VHEFSHGCAYPSRLLSSVSPRLIETLPTHRDDDAFRENGSNERMNVLLRHLLTVVVGTTDREKWISKVSDANDKTLILNCHVDRSGSGEIFHGDVFFRIGGRGGFQDVRVEEKEGWYLACGGNVPASRLSEMWFESGILGISCRFCGRMPRLLLSYTAVPKSKNNVDSKIETQIS
jgi:hypothetical protein